MLADDVISEISDIIGRTPMMLLRFRPENLAIFAKCEFQNPSGSIKDRLARAVIDDAEERGLLKPDSIIVECSSGNTGVALAMVGASRGYRVRIVISEAASRERGQLIRQLGGEVVTFPISGYQRGIEITRKMAAEDPRVFLPRQFENPLNAQDHERETGREILSQIGRTIDAFVSGYGTGGTLTGVGRALRKSNRRVGIFAMEPAEAATMGGESPRCHSIEGVSDGFIPPLLDTQLLTGSVKVRGCEAMDMAQRLSREFGLLVGTSSGANITAALRVAEALGSESTVVTLLPDRAERYFSTRLFAPSDGLSAARLEIVD
jgi:cysteine synthase A